MFKLIVLVFAAILAIAVAKPGFVGTYSAPVAHYGYAAAPYYGGYVSPYAYSGHGYYGYNKFASPYHYVY